MTSEPLTVILPVIPPESMRNHTDDAYFASAIYVLKKVDQLFPLRPSMRVLDVGCAAGRLAMPLLGLLDPALGGSYDGFDVKADRIAWATENISSQFPHFRFRHIDVHSTALNPAGTTDGTTLSFPYESNAFDLIIFHSVFTHLLLPEGRRYLNESRRCVSDSGALYSTWYLWDDASARSVATHDVLWSFPVAADGYRIQDPNWPETAVAYDYDRLVSELADANLRIDVEVRGNWREARSHGQDLLILRPTDA
jgi:SAM-dependent methyltransferase